MGLAPSSMPCDTHLLRSERGFTLIELLMVVATHRRARRRRDRHHARRHPDRPRARAARAARLLSSSGRARWRSAAAATSSIRVHRTRLGSRAPAAVPRAAGPARRSTVLETMPLEAGLELSAVRRPGRHAGRCSAPAGADRPGSPPSSGDVHERRRRSPTPTAIPTTRRSSSASTTSRWTANAITILGATAALRSVALGRHADGCE